MRSEPRRASLSTQRAWLQSSPAMGGRGAGVVENLYGGVPVWRNRSGVLYYNQGARPSVTKREPMVARPAAHDAALREVVALCETVPNIVCAPEAAVGGVK